MWVSRSKWNALEERVKELESRHEGSVGREYFTVYKKVEPAEHYWGCAPDKQYISVKSVVEKLMERAGFSLEYRSGKPAGVDIVETRRKG